MTPIRALPVRPATPRTVPRRYLTLLMTVLAALGLAACSAGTSSAGTSSVPPATTATSGHPAANGGPATPADQVLAAYRDMWSDLVTAARTSDFQSPRLARHATGTVLTLFTRGLARDQLHGIVTRGQPVLHPVVASSSADRATITDCFDDSHWLEYRTSGGLAKNAAGGRRATTAQLVRRSGVWKVDQLSVGTVGTC